MFETLIEMLGDDGTLGAAGLAVGLIFGIMAQRSRFCLRAATVEVAEGQLGPRLAVWLIAFSAALVSVQGAVALGYLDLGAARVLSATGSVSGAVIGGLMFGVGMVLARGCASRLLVLASSGNLRALISGLVVTLVAQAAYRGALSPWREGIAGLWTVPGGEGRDLGAMLGLSPMGVAVLGLAALAGAFVFSRSRAVPWTQALTAAGVGLAIMLGWLATYLISQASFEVVPLSSITFTGPATDTLMALVDEPSLPLSFGIGLVPGVALGAGLSAALAGEWKLERFGADTPMERYLVGAVLMGFGAMLAGGCAVGAGLSGGSALSVTAWLAAFCMWLGAMATQRMMMRRGRLQAA
ncbi:MAG: YeeE/YedE family protein [Rhodobacteraceae bacterium]|nr:MAG: YeeE/YedE family protein [Paracoccaceae bacterium]